MPNNSDFHDFAGKLPYASEMYGVYQPLLGWRSQLTKNWIAASDPNNRIRDILDAHFIPFTKPGDTWFVPEDTRYPASGNDLYKVLEAQALDSAVIHRVRSAVQTFVNQNDGRLPDAQEWIDIVNVDALHLMMSDAHDEIRERMQQDLIAKYPNASVPEAEWKAGEAQFFDRMNYESQIGAFLVTHAEGQGGADPNVLKKLFVVQTAPPLIDILRPGDPLANINPFDTGGSLSPVGLVQIFRQYFFDFGTFLGEPIEHVWLAPGTTMELVEVSTRRTLTEYATEATTETSTRAEIENTRGDELSDAISGENQASTKLGVSTTHTANLYVYQGSGTTDFSIDSTRRTARENTHKQTKEQSQKVANEIRKTFKTTFRAITEQTDTRSRRYVVENTGKELVNYELRRKMRHIGVQLQSVGTQLCWQVYIDDPGAVLGVAELVHVAQPADLAKMNGPELVAYPADQKQTIQVTLPFKPFQGDNDTGNTYEADSIRAITGHIFRGDVNDKIWFHYTDNKVPVPAGFELKFVELRSVTGNHLLEADFEVFTDHFNIFLERVFFPVEGYLVAELEVTMTPSATTKSKIDTANSSLQLTYDEEKKRLARDAYIESIRDRIKKASSIKHRSTVDLREEERTVVYRQLLSRLMLDSWKKFEQDKVDTPDQRRINHVRAEVVRAIFDVDAMLYFVAPEWWMPRRRKGSQKLDPPQPSAGSLPKGAPSLSMTDNDIVSWGGFKEAGRDNYKITEESNPARLGSSLGWLLQLDGDNLRNAFLNAPWVKAIIPVRPGRETAALNWLKSVEGVDGWDADYVGNEPQYANMSVGDVLREIADELEKKSDFANTLATEKVFEFGFDPLEKAFDDTKGEFEVYSQWGVVLPTDQVVAVPYNPKDHM
jgi:hypothetical protein